MFFALHFYVVGVGRYLDLVYTYSYGGIEKTVWGKHCSDKVAKWLLTEYARPLFGILQIYTLLLLGRYKERLPVWKLFFSGDRI